MAGDRLRDALDRTRACLDQCCARGCRTNVCFLASRPSLGGVGRSWVGSTNLGGCFRFAPTLWSGSSHTEGAGFDHCCVSLQHTCGRLDQGRTWLRRNSGRVRPRSGWAQVWAGFGAHTHLRCFDQFWTGLTRFGLASAELGLASTRSGWAWRNSGPGRPDSNRFEPHSELSRQIWCWFDWTGFNQTQRAFHQTLAGLSEFGLSRANLGLLQPSMELFRPFWGVVRPNLAWRGPYFMGAARRGCSVDGPVGRSALKRSGGSVGLVDLNPS